MQKRRRLSKKEREHIYNLFGGHCAYCGCEIEYKEMQVDHIISLEHNNGEDKIENMFPACRSCNYYKSTLSLEKFRQCVENMPNVLLRDNVTYKNAVRFGLIIPNYQKVVFYFERVNKFTKEEAERALKERELNERNNKRIAKANSN